jgi:hypothetical protein
LKPGNNGTGGPNEPAIGTQLITRIVEALRHYPASVRVDRGRGWKLPRSGVRFARPPIRFLRAELAGGQQNSSSASATMMPPGPRM